MNSVAIVCRFKSFIVSVLALLCFSMSSEALLAGEKADSRATATFDCPVLTVAAPFTGGSVGTSYTHTISASGGVAPYIYTPSGGTLPPGLTFVTDQLSGTPTTPGKYRFGVSIEDANFCTTLYTDSIIICGTVALSPSSPLANGTAGSAYSRTITASGSSAPYTFAVTGGTLPAGVTLSSGGTLSGTPTLGGTFSFTVTATDTFGCAGSLAYALTIDCPVISVSSPFPDGSVGQAYAKTISATGGVAPYTYALSGGTIPPGLTFLTGQMSGTPTTPGKYPFQITIQDANLCPVVYRDTVIICGTVALSPSSPLPAGSAGSVYSQSITASGSTAPYAFAVTGGSLPAGLTLNSSGTLSGTPTVTGAFSFTITATDAFGCTGSRTYSLTINCPVITLAPPTLSAGTTGSAYSQTITASGGVGTSTFTVASGVLPAGVTLNSSGALTGTPTVSGAFSFRVRATDANGCNDSLAYTLTVNCPVITLAPPTLPAGTAGTAYSQSITASGGTAPYVFALTSGSLPAGLTLSSSGALTGTPTATGAFSFRVRATDANVCRDSLTYSLTINCPVITLAPPTLPAGTAGSAYSQTITASGGIGTSTFLLVSGALPTGMTLSSSGALTGTPTVTGAFSFRVRGTDANGCKDSLNYSLAINCPVITLSPPTLPAGTTGAAYSQTITASGGIGTSTFAIATGALPAGLTLNSSGALTGTPTASGAFSFRVRATDANGCRDSLAYSLAINCPTITLSPSTLPAGTAGSAYSQSITASGGTAPYVFTVTSGSLPAGLTLNSSGALTGTPTVSGAFSFRVRATDANVCSDSLTYSLLINCPTITLAPPTLPTGTAGSAFSQTISASGGTAPYIFAVTSGSLPTGLTLSSSGALTGTPTVTGAFSFRVRATAANGCNDSLAYSLAIGCPVITLSPPTLPAGTAGSAYSQTITASGGIGTSTFTLASGTLPAGMTLSSAGALTGTPAASGAFSFRVRATDANGCNDSLAYSLAINCPTITLAPPTLPAGTAGSAFSQTITALGGTAPYSFSVTSGSLPAGLTLNSSGALTGTPTVTGAFSFRVRATAANGCNDSLSYSLAINCPTITLAPPTLPTGTAGSAFSQTITASGGTAPYVFALTSGSLPAGLTLNSSGALTGTPTVTGAFSFRVRATAANGCNDSLAYSLAINCPTITLAPPTLPAGTAGSAYSQTITASGGIGSSTFTLASGALPTGMTLSSAGALTGTPTASGAFSFRVRATDANGCNDSLAYSLAINCPTITLAPPTLPTGTAGSAYSQTITASGGTAPYAFAVTSGSLPAGLTLSSSGALTGTPTVTGAFSFKVRATAANGCNDSLAYSLSIGCPAITLAPSTLPAGTAGSAYSQTITASGGIGTSTFTLASGTLPAGITLSSAGALTGTPTASGAFSFRVRATDANGCNDSLAYSLAINCPTITLAPPTLPTGTAGSVFSQTIAASGGTAPYVFTVTSGSLPAGLTLSSSGALTGTPTVTGAFSFRVRATAANGCNDSLSYSLTIGCPTITLSPPTLPAAATGSAYSQTIAASGGIGTSTFTLASGALPTGMTLSSSGALTGTPTVTGAFSFKVRATDVNGCNDSLAYSLTIGCPVITLAPPTLPAGTAGSAYSQTITASGGIGSSTFTLASGALPTGMTLSSSGALTGTPTVTGAFSFKVRATDANACNDSLAYSLTIGCPVITLGPPTLPAGTAGSAYSQTITASGGIGTSTFTLASGALPTGMTLSSSGALTGTPTVTGAFSFRVRATDANGCRDSLAYSLAIGCATITLSPPTLPAGTAGSTYSQSVTASGGIGTSTFTLASGALPAGMTLSAAGVLSGTPTVTGAFSFRVRVTDANSCSDSLAYSLTINCPVITLAPSTVPAGATSSAYSQTITASGGIGVSTFTLASGALPAGITLSPAGVLSGTPTVTGAFSFRVRATDANSCNDSMAYSLAIGCATITLSPPPLPAGTAASAYSQSVTASGGVGTSTFTLASGALPTGMTLSSAGVLSGTPTVTGAFSFRVRATDANGCNDSLAYSLTIGCPTITLAPPTVPSGAAGSAYSRSITASGGIAPYTFAVTAGSLPAGISLSSAGVLSGTPTVTGAFNFRVRATDANGCSDSLAYSLAVNCPVITLSPSTLFAGSAGSAYSQTIVASGAVGTSTFTLTSGALPAGMALSSSGALTGTPTVTGVFSFRVRATDANLCSDSLAYSLTIGCATIALSPLTLPAGATGLAYLQTISASGGVAPYAFTVTGGSLPVGLTLSSSGALTGTPTLTGTFNFRVRATDVNLCNDSLAYSLTIGCATITFSPPTLPPGGTGLAYNHTISAIGGVAPYNFAMTGGSLPAGLTLSASGALTGTPTVTGAFNFRVRVTDANICTDSLAYSLSIGCATITLSPPTLPSGTAGSTLSQTITASGGVGSSTFTLASGALPAGLTLSASGALTGTPTVTGAFSFRVRATDANGCNDSIAYSLAINCPTITLAPPTLPSGTAGSPYSQTITASGGIGASTFTLASGALPAGITLSSSGALTGTPTVTGAFSFRVRATDANGCNDSLAYSLAINCPVITLAPPTLPAGTAGSAYSQTVTASGGIGSFTFTLASGALPAGITLSPSGALTGTPTVTGAFSFRVRATDANGCNDSLAYSLAINCPVITLAPPTLPAGTTGSAYNQTISATGGIGTSTFALASGALPAGLTLSAAGALTGTPTANGAFSFRVRATDANGCSDSLAYSLTINCPVITLAPPTVPTGTTGSAYSQAISATGGNGTSKFTLTSGALPAGMTLSASGALTGTPTVNGTFSFSITATDTFGCTGSLAYSLTIGCPVISLSPPTLPVGTAGSAFSQTIVASGGSGPYSFSILSGALPAGMTLAAGGSLSGTPTASGSFIFAVRATDANGCNGSLGYSLTVNCPAIALSPLTLPGGLNGIPYNQTVSASGGTAPYTFTSGGTLPVGLALSSGGILAGTPTANGGFSFIVVARDANGCSDTVNYVVSIGNCPVASVSSPFPNGSVGQAYSSTIAASGGVAPYTYAHSAGTLPPGLTFLTNQLGGTPTAPGKYQFQISIQDANFCTTVFSDTVIICGAVALSPSLPIPAGTAGSAYSQSITASGSSAPYGFAVTSGSLPAGLTLSSSGALSGTPTVTGAFSFTVTATDAFGCTGSRAYSLTISCPVITLAPPTLPVGTTGSAYNQTITASGGLGTSTFTLSSGTLPAGLGLSSSGTLVGTPTVSGAFSFRVRTTDANGCSDSLAYTLTINCATITFTAAPLPAGFLSTSYSTTVTATGGTVPITFSVIGSLPTGLAISTGGAISGSPTISGKYVFTLKATDLYGCTVSRLDSIIIMAAGVTSVASGDWNAGTTWSQGVKPGPTQNVVISGGNTVALSAGDSCASVTVLNGGVLDIGIFTLGLSGTYTLLPGAEGRQSATNPVPGRGATPWLFDAASTYTIGGASTGFGIGAAPGITFGNLNWSTSAAAAPPAGTVIMGNLVLNGTGEMQCGTGTTSRTTTVHGNVIVNSGTLVASNATAPAAGAIDIDGDLTINASGTLRGVNADGSGTVRIGGSLVNIGGKIRVGDGSGDTGNFIIYFKGTAAGMISPGDSSAFRTVAIAPGRTMTLTDTLRVNATYAVVDSGALYCGTNTIAGAGGFTMVAGATIGTGHPSGISRTTGAGTVSVTGPRTFPGAGAGSFEYNGTVAQLATDSTLFSAARLIINNPAGVSLINDFYVSNQLILQSGTVTMIGGKVLSVGATATVPRGSGHVIGRLSKWIPAGTSVTQTYDVGDATAYAPVDLTFHDVTLADSLIVVTTPGEHPNLSSSGVVASRDINRYFTIVNRGVGFGTADAIFHFAPGDVDPGANTSVFLVAKYDAPSWIYPAVGARTGTATQVTGLTSFSDFAVGEVLLQTISVTQTANGVIAPGTTTIVNGATQSFSITPNPGFIVDSVFADGIYRPDLTTSVTFTNVTASHTLTATFVAPTYTITVTQGANGVIAPGTSVVAVHGTQSFSITPNAGYHLDSLIVDGVRVPGAASYTLTNLRAPHSLRASFVVTTFTISVKQGANGVIAPGTSVVQQFSSKSFTITPNTGYHLDSLLVDGARVDSTVSYTFRAVGAAHTLRAVFAINVYSLTVSTVGSGTVKVAPNQSTYTHGSALTLTALADVGWAFSFWSDGASGSANPLGISMTSNENIIATFVQDSSYQNFFRSFAPESIIVARDNHGYLGKSVNRTPDKVDFKFLMTLPADSIRLTLRFTAICSGAITKGTTKLDTLFRWKNRKYITGLVKMPTDSTIQVSGRSVTGLPVRTTFDWSTRPAHTKGIVGTYVENDPRLPMPNRVNVLEETFAQGGFASTLGLLVGLDRTIDSSRHFGWLLAPRYADVIRTLYDAREAVQHKGQPRGLDVFLDGKPIIGRQRSIYPTKHNNKLLAEMVAVKLNIVASALEMIPLGFGELVYNDGTSNPLNGLMVKQIAALADTLMMGRYAFNVHLFADSAVYANLYATLDTINDAFEGPIDTVDFGAALHLTGVRRLQDVPYLRAGTVPPSRIVPRIIPELAEPIGYQLAQNYPNPFNPTTTISFELPIPSRVSLKIYNMLGQEVATLIDNEELEDGTHDMIFNASELATGVYFYRLTAESVADANQQDQQGYFTSVKKMLLIK